MVLISTNLLGNILNIISQGLLIPVIIGLLLFFAYALLNIGGIFYEFYHRKKMNVQELEVMILSLSKGGTPNAHELIETFDIPKSHKYLLLRLIDSSNLGSSSREAFARKLIESREVEAAKTLEKTDIVTRLGPTLGLMGTLIPMGPGLAALGNGDIQTLAQAIIIAFDTTVVGLASGGIAYVISKIRRRWYEEDLSNLEVLMESLLEVTKR